MKKTFLFFLIFLMSRFCSIAQCALCTKTAQGLDEHAAHDINNAILYLAFIPFSMMVIGGFVWYKYYRKTETQA
jgi:hypothetical protein